MKLNTFNIRNILKCVILRRLQQASIKQRSDNYNIIKRYYNKLRSLLSKFLKVNNVGAKRALATLSQQDFYVEKLLAADILHL